LFKENKEENLKQKCASKHVETFKRNYAKAIPSLGHYKSLSL